MIFGRLAMLSLWMVVLAACTSRDETWDGKPGYKEWRLEQCFHDCDEVYGLDHTDLKDKCVSQCFKMHFPDPSNPPPPDQLPPGTPVPPSPDNNAAPSDGAGGNYPI